MNAYELADGLSKMYIETDSHGLFNKRIQNMLRQQADQIEDLKREIFALQNTLTNRALRTYDGKLE
jgi:hypothetical protein